MSNSLAPQCLNLTSEQFSAVCRLTAWAPSPGTRLNGDSQVELYRPDAQVRALLDFLASGHLSSEQVKVKVADDPDLHTGCSEAELEEKIRAACRRGVAARTLQRFRKRYVDKKLAQASTGVRALLQGLGAEVVHGTHDLKAGDVLVIAAAANGRHRTQWYVHGSIINIQSGEPFGDASDPCIRVTSLDVSSYAQPGDLPEGAIVHASRPGTVNGELTTVGHLELRDRQFHLNTLNLQCSLRQVFRLPATVPFHALKAAYIENARRNGQRPYSRQNNCNHAVYHTLRILHRRIRQPALRDGLGSGTATRSRQATIERESLAPGWPGSSLTPTGIRASR